MRRVYTGLSRHKQMRPYTVRINFTWQSLAACIYTQPNRRHRRAAIFCRKRISLALQLNETLPPFEREKNSRWKRIDWYVFLLRQDNSGRNQRLSKNNLFGDKRLQTLPEKTNKKKNKTQTVLSRTVQVDFNSNRFLKERKIRYNNNKRWVIDNSLPTAIAFQIENRLYR